MAQNDPKIVLIDKPKGITSFDVIRHLRAKLDMKKMGHAGTLDPNATGLMIIALGDSTKELQNLLKLPKVYETEILFGIRTDTGDIEGKIIEEGNALEITEEKIKKALLKITGIHLFPVPKYSAIKVAGKPLYKYARNNEPVELPQKQMNVISAEFKSIKKEENYMIANITFEVTSGTYIRTLAEEIGKDLGVPATLRNLRRTSIGDFHIENAEKL